MAFTEEEKQEILEVVKAESKSVESVSYTHLRAHET